MDAPIVGCAPKERAHDFRARCVAACVNHASGAMPAFTGQIKSMVMAVETGAKRLQEANLLRRALDDEVNSIGNAKSAARAQGVVGMGVNAVFFGPGGGDTALGTISGRISDEALACDDDPPDPRGFNRRA